MDGAGMTPPAFRGGSSAGSIWRGVSRPMLPAHTGLAPGPTRESFPGIFPPIFVVFPPVTGWLPWAG